MGLTGYAVVAAAVVIGVALLRRRTLRAHPSRRGDAAGDGTRGWIPASDASPEQPKTDAPEGGPDADGTGAGGD